MNEAGSDRAMTKGKTRLWQRSLRRNDDALAASRRRRGEAGFTLVEMLVVITIIGLIMGLVGPRVLNYLAESKVKAATIQIESLDGALDLYFLDLGRYPTTAQGLAALVQRPGGVSGWNGPYLKNGNVPNDPWGRPYVYRSPSDHGAYEIVSLGSSGQEGGTGNASAIKSWEIGATKKAQQQ
jgi:general secretion pathway protein G